MDKIIKQQNKEQIDKEKPIEYVFMDDMSIWASYNETYEFLNDLSGQVPRGSTTGIPCKPILKVLEDELIIGIITETNQFVQINPPISENDMNINHDYQLPTIKESYIDYENKENPENIDSILTSTYENLDNTERGVSIIENVDKDRVMMINNMRMETNYFNLFRNTVRIFLNKYENNNIRIKIEDEIEKDYLLLNEKRKNIVELLRKLLQNKVVFTDDYSNKNNTEEEKEETEEKEEKENKVYIPTNNLMTGKPNEIVYYSKLADQIVRYNTIRSYLFDTHKYITLQNITYEVAKDEIIILQSLLTQDYLKSLNPIERNKYVNLKSYDDSIPYFVNDNINQIYTNIKTEQDVEDILNREDAKNKEKTEKGKRKKIIPETKIIDKPQPIVEEQPIIEEEKEPIEEPIIEEQQQEEPIIEEQQPLVEEQKQQEVTEEKEHLECLLKEREKFEKIASYKVSKKDKNKKLYKLLEFKQTIHCTFYPMIYLLKRVKNIDTTTFQLKQVLIKQYSKYFDKYSDKIIDILRNECKEVFYKNMDRQGYKIYDENKGKPVPLEKLVDYITNKTEKEYYLTTFDYVLLVNYYKLNTVFISNKPMPTYRRTGFIGYSDDEILDFNIEEYLKSYVKNKSLLRRPLTQEEINTEILPDSSEELNNNMTYSYIVIPIYEKDNGKGANKYKDPEYKLIGVTKIDVEDDIEVSFSPIDLLNDKKENDEKKEKDDKDNKKERKPIKKTKKNSKGGMKRKTRKIRK
jgi:hypothetical protein